MRFVEAYGGCLVRLRIEVVGECPALSERRCWNRFARGYVGAEVAGADASVVVK